MKTVVMYHPDNGPKGAKVKVAVSAFNRVWEKRGWIREADTPQEDFFKKVASAKKAAATRKATAAAKKSSTPDKE